MALRTLASRRAFSLISVFERTPMEHLDYLKTKPKHETFGLPWSFTGYEQKEPLIRYMADRQLIQTKTSLRPILSQFNAMYKSVLKCLILGDMSPVQGILDGNLIIRLEMMLKSLKAEGKSLRLEVNQGFEKQHPKPTVNIHDAAIFRGLSHKRSENEALEAYHVNADGDLGLVCFTHLDLSNQYAYVDQKNIEKLHQRNRQCLLQYLVFLKSPFQLRLIGPDGSDISKYSPKYTFGQEWVFETQLVAPPKFMIEDKSENYMEWIAKHLLSDWRVADMSEFMDGNPLVIKQTKMAEEKTEAKEKQ